MRLELLLRLGVAGLMASLIGCNSKTVFQSSFDPNTVGGAPSLNQATGTINVSGTPGSVLIVPAPATASGHWAQIQRAAGLTAPISAMQCNFAPYQQNGTYSATAVLFIPSGSGLVSLEFDTAPQASPPSQGFLHLDFGDFTVDKQVHQNTVRINDDDTQLFGTFPRDQFFTVIVGLDINSSPAMATPTSSATALQAPRTSTSSPARFRSRWRSNSARSSSSWALRGADRSMRRTSS